MLLHGTQIQATECLEPKEEEEEEEKSEVGSKGKRSIKGPRQSQWVCGVHCSVPGTAGRSRCQRVGGKLWWQHGFDSNSEGMLNRFRPQCNSVSTADTQPAAKHGALAELRVRVPVWLSGRDHACVFVLSAISQTTSVHPSLQEVVRI